MSVTLQVPQDAAPNPADVIAKLREMKLAGFDDGLVIQALEQGKGKAVSVVVATGRPAVDERPAKIQYRVPVADGVNCTVAKVEADQVVATFTPGVAGSDGHDVFGTALPHQKNSIQFGRNLVLVKE